MKKFLSISLALLFFCPFITHAQFVLNGSASITPSQCYSGVLTYQLTPPVNTQAGEIWNTTLVNLNQSFDVHFQLFLGAKNYTSGADGLCFVFQQQSITATGATGYGFGYAGIKPSLAVEFDTHQNGYDPAYCHTAIEKNGDVDHTDSSGNNLAGPIQLDPLNPNIPDSNWYNMEITWNANTKTLSVYFNCNLRLSYTGNVVNSIFGGNPMVYWGFTGGTGGKNNVQAICLAPSPVINMNDTTICAGSSVTLTTTGIGPYLWSNGDTTASINVTPASSTDYFVILSNDTCFHGASAMVNVNQYPNPTISPDTVICAGRSINLIASGADTYSWMPATGLACNTCSSTIAAPVTTTEYTVTYANGPCTATDSVNVRVKVSPIITVCCDTVINPGQAVQLASSGIGNYIWAPSAGLSCTDCANPIVTTDINETYTLTITNDSACTVSQTVTIEVGCGNIFVPDAFSPNGDGQNDILYVRGDCIQTMEFEIFDRWGNRIFETDNQRVGWNGMHNDQVMNTGVYVYYLSVTAYNGKVYTKKGNITLIR